MVLWSRRNFSLRDSRETWNRQAEILVFRKCWGFAAYYIPAKNPHYILPSFVNLIMTLGIMQYKDFFLNNSANGVLPACSIYHYISFKKGPPLDQKFRKSPPPPALFLFFLPANFLKLFSFLLLFFYEGKGSIIEVQSIGMVFVENFHLRDQLLHLGWR